MYTLHPISDNIRLIEMPADDSLRYRFYKHEDKKQINFERNGSKLQALVKGKIVVYKKPNANVFHRELMRQNGLAQYRGLPGCDSERLTENMLECLEII